MSPWPQEGGPEMAGGPARERGQRREGGPMREGAKQGSSSLFAPKIDRIASEIKNQIQT